MMLTALGVSLLLTASPIDTTRHENAVMERDYSHAFQLGVAELVGGAIGIKYELLMNRRDGIFVDVSFANTSTTEGKIITAGYRRHKDRKMKGGFWGLFATYADYEAEYKEKTDEGTTKHPYAMRSISMGPYIGKRWILGSGFSIVTRFGYGYPFTDFSWLEDPPAEHPDLAKGIITFLEGMDGEFSLGFCF